MPVIETEGDPWGYDAFFETDTNGVLNKGRALPVVRAADNLMIQRVSLLIQQLVVSGFHWNQEAEGLGIFEINPNNGTVVSHLNVGPAFATRLLILSLENYSLLTKTGLLRKWLQTVVVWQTVVDIPGVGFIFGMAFTPTGDLVLLDFAAVNYGIPLPSQLLLYDSTYDADDFFTTAIPVTIDIKPGSDPNSINPKSKGKIPVAILSTQDFDAPQMVDKDSLTFGPSVMRTVWPSATTVERILTEMD